MVDCTKLQKIQIGITTINAENKNGVSAWRPMETAPTATRVLIKYQQPYGKKEIVEFGIRFEKGQEEIGTSAVPIDFVDEINGVEYWPAGWYRIASNECDDELYLQLHNRVTGWMPIPEV